MKKELTLLMLFLLSGTSTSKAMGPDDVKLPQKTMRKSPSQKDLTSQKSEDEITKLAPRHLTWEQTQAFSQTVRGLWTPDMSGEEKESVTCSVSEVDPKHWGKFSTTVKGLWTDDMSGKDKQWVVSSVSKVDPKHWGELSTTVKGLWKPDMSGEDKESVTCSVSKVDPKHWGKFSTTVKGLWTDDMSGKYKQWVTSDVSKVDPKDWDAFSTTVQGLWTPDMSTKDKRLVTSDVSKLDPKDWDAFSNVIKTIPANMTGYKKAVFIYELGIEDSATWKEQAPAITKKILERFHLKKEEEDRRIEEQLRLNNSLNPRFDMEANALTPTGWTLVNSSQKNVKPATLKKKPIGVELLGDNYTFSHDLPDLQKFDQVTFLFSVELRSTNPGVYLQYWDGGKNPVSSAPYASKKGEWETLNIKFTVDGNAKFHRLYSAIQGVIKNNDKPSVDIRSIKLEPKKL